MEKMEVCEALLEFTHQLPHAEAIFEDIAIVKQQNSASAHFWQPCVKVVANGFIRVKTVNVQQVDTAVGKLFERVVKLHSHQA